MKSNISPLQTETFYHIYNRGINGENIFKAPDNYPYFLTKYKNYIPNITDTYAYCLLKNHFHILIKTHSEDEIKQASGYKKDKTSSQLISLQFSHLFNGYTQAINKRHHRTGGLFETPSRRKEIKDEYYLKRLLFYIHFNAEKHGMCTDFRNYPYSSYQAFLSKNATAIKKEAGINWFEGEADFINFHLNMKGLQNGI